MTIDIIIIWANGWLTLSARILSLPSLCTIRARWKNTTSWPCHGPSTSQFGHLSTHKHITIYNHVMLFRTTTRIHRNQAARAGLRCVRKVIMRILSPLSPVPFVILTVHSRLLVDISANNSAGGTTRRSCLGLNMLITR